MNDCCRQALRDAAGSVDKLRLAEEKTWRYTLIGTARFSRHQIAQWLNERARAGESNE